MVSCNMLANKVSGTHVPDFFRMALWPFTEEDLKFCSDADEDNTPLAEVRIEADSAHANFGLPIGQCDDGFVPSRRPVAQHTAESQTWTMALPASCPFDFVAVRTFAQHEFE